MGEAPALPGLLIMCGLGETPGACGVSDPAQIAAPVAEIPMLVGERCERHRLEVDPYKPSYLIATPGVGYSFQQRTAATSD